MGLTNDNNLNRIITIRKHITYLKFALDNYLVLGSMCPNLITLITLKVSHFIVFCYYVRISWIPVWSYISNICSVLQQKKTSLVSNYYTRRIISNLIIFMKNIRVFTNINYIILFLNTFIIVNTSVSETNWQKLTNRTQGKLVQKPYLTCPSLAWSQI